MGYACGCIRECAILDVNVLEGEIVLEREFVRVFVSVGVCVGGWVNVV